MSPREGEEHDMLDLGLLTTSVASDAYDYIGLVCGLVWCEYISRRPWTWISTFS